MAHIHAMKLSGSVASRQGQRSLSQVGSLLVEAQLLGSSKASRRVTTVSCTVVFATDLRSSGAGLAVAGAASPQSQNWARASDHICCSRGEGDSRDLRRCHGSSSEGDHLVDCAAFQAAGFHGGWPDCAFVNVLSLGSSSLKQFLSGRDCQASSLKTFARADSLYLRR